MRREDLVRIFSRARRWGAALPAALTLALALVPFGAQPARAAEPPVFVDGDGLAIRGYDPVAYFEEARPVRGRDEWNFRWRGAVWRFASEEHRDAFRAAPERFAPEYGGFCAYAMSLGKRAAIDPEAWDVVDGRLYLNYSPGVRRDWLKKRDERIERADRNWARMIEEDR
jgi:YHS domain-containing protein